MTLFASPSVLLPTALAFLSLSQLSTARLSGCDSVNCPLDQYRQPSCVLGNTTARALGITSFTNPLSSDPFTWTIMVQSVNGPNDTFERDFFLGTPPAVNLTTSQNQSCALFFDGVAPRTMFPGTDPEYDQGTCDDALTQTCVNDLRTQARTELTTIRSGSGGGDGTNSTSLASTCGKLGDALRDKAPTACTVASGGHWGDILVRPLTGMAAAKPVKQGDCHPTTGKDYDLALVAANRINAASRNTSDLEAILFGITPIMTVVYGGGVSDDMEVDLSCLKTIGPKTNTSSPNQASGAVGARMVEGKASTLLVGMFGLSACFLSGWLV